MHEHTTSTRRTVLRALSGAAVVVGATRSAAAQDDTSTPTGTATPDPTPKEGEHVVAELGPVVTLRSWEYTDGVFSLTLTAEYPSSIKITDTGAVMQALTEGSGAATVEIPSQGFQINNRTTVEFDAVEFDGAAALTVASTRGTVLIRTDSVSAGKPAIAYDRAALGIVGTAVGTGWYSFRRGRAKLEESDEPEAERLA